MPVGIHETDFRTIETRLAVNPYRRFANHLALILVELKRIGVKEVFIGGSFVASKKRPGDIDIAIPSYSEFLTKVINRPDSMAFRRGIFLQWNKAD